MADDNLIELTADIVSAHVSHNIVPTSELPALINSVFEALSNSTKPAEPEAPKPEPAVTIRASVKPDHIVCLEDGKKLKMLKRYLRTNYNMSPEDYRTKWGLPRDYPYVDGPLLARTFECNLI
ncbi:MucR family transcriptional regulator [Sphingomonas oryzagri]